LFNTQLALSEQSRIVELKRRIEKHKRQDKYMVVNGVHPSWATSLGLLPMSDHFINDVKCSIHQMAPNLQETRPLIYDKRLNIPTKPNSTLGLPQNWLQNPLL
jgi:hypothetical protein